MIDPTPDQRAAAAEWIRKWRLDDSHGHVEALAELLAKREAAIGTLMLHPWTIPPGARVLRLYVDGKPYQLVPEAALAQSEEASQDTSER